MEIEFSEEGISFEKELNDLDKLVLPFVSILDTHKISYVLMSGYVAILFGRSRSSEDIDMFIEKMSYEKFSTWWDEVTKEFECVNTPEKHEAYHEYLNQGVALRFSWPGTMVPNIEVKFPKIDIDKFSMEQKKKVVVNGYILYVSPIEVQIAYKLFLGSEKDIEDACHLFIVLKAHLDLSMLDFYCRKLNIDEKRRSLLQ